MTILQAKLTSPSSMSETGDRVLSAARTMNVALIKAKLGAFAKAHAAFVAAEKAVRSAETSLRAQEEKVGEADVTQDEAVEALARARIADGAWRRQPFKALGFDAPSVIEALGYAKEANVARRLAKKAAEDRTASKTTVAAARALDRAALAVLAALAPIPKLEKARRDAVTARWALTQPWATAFAALKRGARAAEDDGARDLFATLFADRLPARRKATKTGAANGAAASS